ncbi:septum formation family protein [Actinomadura violacea]|uniref:Septum formation family protein n=1 Tax=Actinomadura violacea TaxID=2819934 RepID=A0ABS3RSA9_9ACTN|nr:septum formation family protein [Actinomadura violacea]MBO2459645.1 septum formation family protein [Actinomadura violacea]
MTTPPDADDVQDTPEEPSAAAAWTPPDAGTTAAPPPPEHAAAPAPPPPPGPPPAPGPRRTNRFAIVALLAGIFGLVVFAIGFAIATFVQTSRRNEKGKGLAAAGLAASAVWIAAATLVLAMGVLHTTTGGVDAPASKGGKPRVTTLLAGDCFTGLEDGLTSVYVTKTPCTQPHEGEIGAVVTLADLPYPGDGSLVTEATKECKDRTRFLMNNRYSDDLELHIDRPRREAWSKGRHDVTCVLRYTGSEKLTAPLTSAEWGARTYLDLVAGDCVDKWRERALLTTVDCKKKHELQVIAKYDMRGHEYPTKDTIEAKAMLECAKRTVKVFAKRPLPRHVVPWYLYPSKEGWQEGDRRIVCMFKADGAPLTSSVLPK